MSRNDGRRAERGEGKTRRKAREEAKIQELLLEAEEVLRELEVPSGQWTEEAAGSLSAEPRAGSRNGGLWDGIPAEAAFWLLFPPRGNA
jgi:hypothetical protein